MEVKASTEWHGFVESPRPEWQSTLNCGREWISLDMGVITSTDWQWFGSRPDPSCRVRHVAPGLWASVRNLCAAIRLGRPRIYIYKILLNLNYLHTQTHM